MVQLEDDNTLKRRKHSLAEMSRPYRMEKKQAHQNKKPQGQMRKKEGKDAIYHNWHSPFLWSQIVLAAKHPSVGHKMSARKIAGVLQLKNPTDFLNISHNTIDGWIDRQGAKPRWSDAALRMAELGNHQGHSKGGRKSILVRLPGLI